MNQLLAIRAFARVVETGSFTKAADSIGLPKASVSKLVQDLEAHLGAKLLSRTTRRLTVTADGQAYYERTARLVRELEDIDTEFAGEHVRPRGSVRVDVGGTLATRVIIPALPEFCARYPDVHIELGVTDRSVDLVGDNVDCAIRGGPLPDQSVVARALGTTPWVTCATPGYLQRFGRPTHPRDFERDHRLVAYRSPHTGRIYPARFQRGDEVIDVEGRAPLSTNESNAHLAAALSGIGVVHTFKYAVAPYLASGELVALMEDWRPPDYSFHVVYPPNRHMSQRVRVFIDWLAQRFKSFA